MDIVLFDNELRHQLYPFTHTRAVGTIRSGIFTPQERWQHILGKTVQLHTTKLLQPLYGNPQINSNTLCFIKRISPLTQIVSYSPDNMSLRHNQSQNFLECISVGRSKIPLISLFSKDKNTLE